jgi:vacuolar-type H+-ATPase subunit I/STV1
MTARVQERNMAKVQAELAKSTYGKALLHLVELHSMAGGPVQELIDAIEELINDLEEELEELELNFKARTNEHNQLVVTLE